MGDGSLITVGLSLAKQIQIFLLNKLAGGSLKNADFPFGSNLASFTSLRFYSPQALTQTGLFPVSFTHSVGFPGITC